MMMRWDCSWIFLPSYLLDVLWDSKEARKQFFKIDFPVPAACRDYSSHTQPHDNIPFLRSFAWLSPSISLLLFYTQILYTPFEKGESPKVRLNHSKYLIISLVFKPLRSLVLRRKQPNGERHLFTKKSILDLVS